DLLRLLGPLTTDEVAVRVVADSDEAQGPEGTAVRTAPVEMVRGWLEQLATARRAVRVPVGGRNCWAAIEDVGRLRDGLGVPPPPGTPDAFRTETADPLGDLVGRYARTHGPFEAAAVAARLGLGIAVVHDVLRRLAADDRVVEGEFTPGTTGVQWCDTRVLRRLRR